MYRRTTRKLSYLENKPVVYKLQQLTYPVVTSDNLMKYISQSANVPESSIRSCVAAIAQAIAYYVINGHAVHFDGFGTFNIRMQQKVQMEEDKVSVEKIRRLIPNFIAHKELRQDVARTQHRIYGTVSLTEEDV